MPDEGEIRVNRLDPNRKAVWSGGQWYEIGGNAGSKPLPVGVQKLEADELEQLGAAGSMNQTIATNRDRLERGSLDVGPLANKISEAKNWLGRSDESSRNYASFRAGLEKMRNDSLRLNKGTQTEGDATRAWNELMANLNDEGLVAQRLEEIQAMNDRVIQQRTTTINQRRRQYGLEGINPADYGAGKVKAPVPRAARSASDSMRRDLNAPFGSERNPYVARDMDTLNRLPKGSYVIAPNGDFGVID